MAEPGGRAAEAARRARTVELVTTRLLRVGVVASLVVVVVGMVVTFLQHRSYLSSAAALDRLVESGAAFPHTVPSVARGVLAGEGDAVVMAGLLMLVATPVVRVAGLVLAFAYQRDRPYVVVTSLVLVLLLASFALGRAVA